MIGHNRIVIAAAGSGKTTYLVEEAVKAKGGRVLITTYTESNEAEIRQKFYELVGHVPANVVIMTWFRFLIAHCVKPFQGGLFEFRVAGMLLVGERSGLRYPARAGRHPVYWAEEEFERHYFDPGRRIYSDKLSKLALRCDEKSDGAVIDRIGHIFQHVFVDEVQDLAGCDLDILVSLARSSVRLLMVGDPRQVTYLTHHERRHEKYADGGIVDFLREKLPKRIAIEIDETSLNRSHRNSASVCALSSRLYPSLAASQPCACAKCRAGSYAEAGPFIVRTSDYSHYLASVRPMQLRDKINSHGVDPDFPVMNFGASKGRGFDHVIILPTKKMTAWLVDPASGLQPQSRAKLYVALTRARYSVAIATDLGKAPVPAGFSLYERSTPVRGEG